MKVRAHVGLRVEGVGLKGFGVWRSSLSWGTLVLLGSNPEAWFG